MYKPCVITQPHLYYIHLKLTFIYLFVYLSCCSLKHL